MDKEQGIMGDVDILDLLAPLIFIFLLSVLALGVIKVVFFKKLRKNNKRKNNSSRKEPKVKKGKGDSKETSLTEKLVQAGGAYKGNVFFMTPNERNVYKMLEKTYGDKYYIFA